MSGRRLPAEMMPGMLPRASLRCIATLSAKVRHRWELPDVALIVHLICSQPTVSVKSYRLGHVLAPGAETDNDHRAGLSQQPG